MRVAIVGGGPGGLLTAFFLDQKSSQPLDITLYEADGRLGGKIRTETFSTAPIPYEAGAAELYKFKRDPLWLLVTRTLALPIIRMHGSAVTDGREILSGKKTIRRRFGRKETRDLQMFGSTVVLGDRVVRNKHDILRHFGQHTWQALKKFHKQAVRARSFQEFYDSGWPEDNDHPWSSKTLGEILAAIPDDNARHYLKTLLHSDLATEPHLTDGLYGLENFLINDDRYCKLYSIKGGLERLIDALAARVSAKIELNTAVKSVARVPNGRYRVTTSHNGADSSSEFDVVIVALPNYWLPRVEWVGERLDRAMTRHHAYYDHPAHYLRITVLTKRPFWRDAFPESFFLHDAFGGCCVYDEGSRHDTGQYGVLGWLLSGDDAMVMSNLPDDVLIQRAIQSLPKRIASTPDMFLEGKVHRWIATVNALPGGEVLKGAKARHRPDSRDHPGVIVVGDYLFDSTINGTLDSADIATDLALKELGVASKILSCEYFDYYDGKATYKESFKLAFDATYVRDLLRVAFGAAPPYKLLDAGSANGLTIPAFEKIGIDAWGIENNWYVHAQTPRRLVERNLLGDVCAMPFDDDFFDYAYETCLAYVPQHLLDQAIRELWRVTKHGVFFSSVAKDFGREVIRKYDLLDGANSVMTLKEWSEIFERNGFRVATEEPGALSKIWEIERAACGGETWYRSAASMRYCFYEKVPRAAEVRARNRRATHRRTHDHDDSLVPLRSRRQRQR
ncbi:MAG TPA: FAD-dependent oxidoreductase [Thermoanaerobaculia bacterium]|nr:FAD-dependent oxidoreductase [Thermoanaerobaculia bacterium]